MNYGILSAAVPHYDAALQRASQRPFGGVQSAQGWHTQPGRTGATVSVGINLIDLSPMVFAEVSVLEILGFEVVTASAGTTGKIAVYDSDPTGMPAQLRGYFGLFDSSTTGFKNVQVGMVVEPGVLWAALWTSSAGAAYRSVEGTNLDSLHQAGGGQAANTLPSSGYAVTSGLTEFPGYIGSSRLSGNSPTPRASWKVAA